MYIDSPYHFRTDRAALVELSLQQLVKVPIVVIRAEGTRPATADQLGDPSRQWGHVRPAGHRMVAALGAALRPVRRCVSQRRCS
jgi:hypothetical protein